jgi:hypothetical protein
VEEVVVETVHLFLFTLDFLVVLLVVVEEESQVKLDLFQEELQLNLLNLEIQVLMDLETMVV